MIYSMSSKNVRKLGVSVASVALVASLGFAGAPAEAAAGVAKVNAQASPAKEFDMRVPVSDWSKKTVQELQTVLEDVRIKEVMLKNVIELNQESLAHMEAAKAQGNQSFNDSIIDARAVIERYQSDIAHNNDVRSLVNQELQKRSSNGGPVDAPGAAVSSVGAIKGASSATVSADVSKRVFPKGAKVVYLVRDDVLADALSATALRDGPKLFVPRTGKASTAVKNEIARINPQQVVAIGSTGAISAATLKSAAGSRKTGRIAGDSRYSTAALITNRAFPKGARQVYVANSASMVDALAGGTLKDGPVLPLPPNGYGIPKEIRSEIMRLKSAKVDALGGISAVTAKQLREASLGGKLTQGRLAGSDRYATAAVIAKRAFPKGSSEVVVVSGTDFHSTLVGSSLNMPIYMAMDGYSPKVTSDAVKSSQVKKITLVGNKGLTSGGIKKMLD